MAANPPYRLINATKEIFLFSINHDDNVIDHIVLQPGQYIVFNKDPTEGHNATDLERQKLTQDLFSHVGKGFNLTDNTGTSISASQFYIDNPPVDTSNPGSGGTTSKDFEESIWTDGTNYFIRRTVYNPSTDSYSSSFFNPNGTSASPNMATIYPFAKDVENPPLIYTNTNGSPFTLTSSWGKVITTTALTKGLRIVPLSNTSVFDIEWTSVAAGAAAPLNTETGEALFGGQDFETGIPIGDIYLRSSSGQKVTIKTA